MKMQDDTCMCGGWLRRYRSLFLVVTTVHTCCGGGVQWIVHPGSLESRM